MKRLLMTVGILWGVLCAGTAVFAAGQQGKTGDAAGPVTIELWYTGNYSEYGPPPANWKVLQLIRDKLDINLVLNSLSSDTNDQNAKINAAAAANALGDLFKVNRDVLINVQKIGLVAPVDELYPLMPNRTQKQFNADARTFTTIGGKSYGFATPGQMPNNEGILIRKDWLDKLNLQVPVTTDDFLKVMRAFTNNDPDGNGKADTWGYGAFIEIIEIVEGLGRRIDPLMGAFGVAGTWNMTKANPGLNVRKPAYFEAMSYVKQLVDEKIIDPNWTSYKKDDFRAAWKQGRFGIMREQWNAFSSESNYLPFDQNFPNGSWIIINPPRGPRGDSSVGACVQSYAIHAVSARAMQGGKGPAIAKLMEWMYLDEGYNLLTYGEEGVNYVKDKNGLPTQVGIPDPSKGFTRPETIPLLQLSSVVGFGGIDSLRIISPDYVTANSKKPMSPITNLIAMMEKPWTFVLGADTLPLPGTDLKRFYEQGLFEFLTGNRALNQANWTAWVAEFDRLGGADWEKAGIAAAQSSGFLK